MTDATPIHAEAIREIVAHRLGWNGAIPPLDAHFIHDLYCDVETLVAIIEDVEDRFGVEFTDDEIEAFNSVRELAALVDRHAKAEAA